MSARAIDWETARPEPYWFDPFFASMVGPAAAQLPAPRERRPRLLHLGCGTGVKTETWRRLGYEAVGIDLDGDLLRRARASFPESRFVQGDMSAMPFGDATFDAVFSFSTLQLVENKRRVVEEAARVLRPGGRALFIENLRGNPLARGYRALHAALGFRYSVFEKPKAHLDFEDLGVFETRFTDVATSFHHLSTPLTLVVPAMMTKLRNRPMRVHSLAAYRAFATADRFALRHVPWMKRFAWHVVATMVRRS